MKKNQLEGSITNVLGTMLREAKILIEIWREFYNHWRPHSALGYTAPADSPLKVI